MQHEEVYITALLLLLLLLLLLYRIHSLFSGVAECMARLGNWKCVVLVDELKREHLLVERNFSIKRDFLGRLCEDVDEVLKF